MKYIAEFLLFTVAVCHGLRLPAGLEKAILKDDPVECPSVFSCKDCNTVRVCHPDDTGNLILYKEAECPSERPWCDDESGTCTDKEPPRCGLADDFICLKNNHYFPDTECHRFHYCDNKYEAKLFECNPNTKVFNPLKQTCDDPSITPCNTFDCTNSAVKKTRHGEFIDYYAMCDNAQANSNALVVNVCPEMYVLNTTSQLCEPDCKRFSSMNIPDIEDCHSYFHCKIIYFMEGQQVIKPEKYTCPDGMVYDSTLFQCNQGTCSNQPNQ